MTDTSGVESPASDDVPRNRRGGKPGVKINYPKNRAPAKNGRPSMIDTREEDPNYVIPPGLSLNPQHEHYDLDAANEYWVAYGHKPFASLEAAKKRVSPPKRRVINPDAPATPSQKRAAVRNDAAAERAGATEPTPWSNDLQNLHRSTPAKQAEARTANLEGSSGTASVKHDRRLRKDNEGRSNRVNWAVSDPYNTRRVSTEPNPVSASPEDTSKGGPMMWDDLQRGSEAARSPEAQRRQWIGKHSTQIPEPQMAPVSQLQDRADQMDDYHDDLRDRGKRGARRKYGWDHEQFNPATGKNGVYALEEQPEWPQARRSR